MAPGWQESGEASWYGAWHQGRRTSSGEIFDPNRMTAAHASLPLGSRVRVTMADTGQSVVVTITDRQPVKRYRIIDLSRGAAARIGLVNQGVGQVRLELTADEPEELAYIGEEDDDDVSPTPRGLRHTPRVRPAVAAARPCCRAPSGVPVRNSVQRPAGLQKL